MIETWFLMPNTTGSALGGVGTAAAGLLWLVAWLTGGVGLLSWLWLFLVLCWASISSIDPQSVTMSIVVKLAS